jgi:tetratricopeptide (TPR) repeat protein
VRALLVVLLPLTLAACATLSAAYHPQKDCEAGSPAACSDWGNRLLAQGDLPGAEAAHGKACEEGLLDSCIAQGRLLMQLGNLEAAEHPLRKAYVEEIPDSYEALAEFHEARQAPGDKQVAESLRWDATALDKPFAELVVAYRASSPGALGTAMTVNVQPMVFFSRRLSLGLHAVTGAGPAELNGFIGYQHFLTSVAVTYARLLVGSVSDSPGGRLNLGGEMGLKLCWGPIGHLDFAVGSSAGSPLHVSVGVGFNAIFLLLAR